MKILHTKSPCCQGKIYRFGNKRRKCVICGKTWTAHRKRQGRKSYRVNKELLKRVLAEGRSLTQEMKKDYPSLASLRYRFRKAIIWITRQPRHFESPDEQLILLVDALWFRFRKENWTLYLMALKPVSDNRAILLDPVLLNGGESYENWQTALETMPDRAKECIVALVSDNFGAAQMLAQRYGWVHQLCHFHLISQLQIRRGRRKYFIKGKNLREKIYHTIREALEITNEENLNTLLVRLKRYGNHQECPYRLKMAANEFVRTINLYRAYLLYPELNLPTTTNAIEATAKRIRQMARSISTPKALSLWAKALIRLRPEITCNSKNFQQN